MFPVLKYAILHSTQEVTYLCNLKQDPDYNIKFVRDLKLIIIRKCDPSGVLIDLKTSATKLKEKPWLLLTVKTFVVDGRNVDVPVCETCNNCTNYLCCAQSNETIANVTCIHCKVAANVIRNFNSCWTLEGALFLAPDDEESDRVEIFHIKEGRSAKSQHLALGTAKFMF